MKKSIKDQTPDEIYSMIALLSVKAYNESQDLNPLFVETDSYRQVAKNKIRPKDVEHI